MKEDKITEIKPDKKTMKVMKDARDKIRQHNIKSVAKKIAVGAAAVALIVIPVVLVLNRSDSDVVESDES